MSHCAINDAFNPRAHWDRVYRRAWQAGRLGRLQGLPPPQAAPMPALAGERDMTRVHFLRHRLALHRDDIECCRRWVNSDGAALCLLQMLDASRNDLDDANPMYWGHVAHVEEGNPVGVCAAFRGGRHVGDLVLQFDARLQRVVAIHDLRVFLPRCGDGEALVASVLAAAPGPVKIVQANPGAPAFWSAMGGNGFFDPYGNVNLGWDAYAHRRLDMPVGARAHWDALYAEGDARDWSDPERRLRRVRISAAAQAASRRQIPPPPAGNT